MQNSAVHSNKYVWNFFLTTLYLFKLSYKLKKKNLWLSALSLIAWNTNFYNSCTRTYVCPSKQRHLASKYEAIFYFANTYPTFTLNEQKSKEVTMVQKMYKNLRNLFNVISSL